MNDDDPNDTIQVMQQKARDKVTPFRIKFPRVFAKLDYISCGPGWYPLIEDLSGEIEAYLDRSVPEELRDQVYYSQIKEKFGGLRVHLNHWIDYIEGAVSLAESHSFRICEKCGNPGTTHNIRNWISTLCPLHEQERREEKR